MKKIYVTTLVAVLCTGVSLFAQDAPAKKFFLGGTGGFNSETRETLVNVSTTPGAPVYVPSKYTLNTYSISPEFGYYIKQNIALGIKLSYSHSGSQGGDGSSYYAASPFVRFIIPFGKSRFSVYNDLGLSAGFSDYDDGIMYGMPVRIKSLNLGAFYEPGLQFRLKNNINLLASLGNLFSYSYNQEKVKFKDPNPANIKEMNSSSHRTGIITDFGALNSFRIGINLLF